MFFTSTVVHGKQIGRKMGFPTANLLVDTSVWVPHVGVYAARAFVDGVEHKAMVYVGTRPSVEQGGETLVEVNIIDFEGDLYAQQLGVEIIEKVRGEQKFESLELLRQQITRDKERIIEILEK